LNPVFQVLLLGIVSAALQAQTAEPVPEANPSRPTVSTPATLTPVGYLQFENGAMLAEESPEFSSRLGISHITKLAVTPRFQFILLSEPFVRSRIGNAAHELGISEVFAGAQAVMFHKQGLRPTLSFSYIRRLYIGPDPELDIGTFHQGGTVLLSGDVAGFHYDVNGVFNQQIEGPSQRAQFGQTLSISHPWKKFTISGELWHFTQPFFNSDAIGNLWSISYPVRRNLVLDAGFQHGFTSTSTQWEVFGGFTYLLPQRLW
jgi:hypothetical protein